MVCGLHQDLYTIDLREYRCRLWLSRLNPLSIHLSMLNIVRIYESVLIFQQVVRWYLSCIFWILDSFFEKSVGVEAKVTIAPVSHLNFRTIAQRKL